jgi:hypothetical protein
MIRDGFEGVFRVRSALRTAEMRKKHNSAMIPKQLDCRETLPDPSVISDPGRLPNLFDRHIEIYPYQYPLPRDIQITDRELWHRN